MSVEVEKSPLSPPATAAATSVEPREWSFYYWSKDCEATYTLLKECLSMRDRDGNPRGLQIRGESRAGKSSFIKNAVARMAREWPSVARNLLLVPPPLQSRFGIDHVEHEILVRAEHPFAFQSLNSKDRLRYSQDVMKESSGVIVDEAHLFLEEKTRHFQAQSMRWVRLSMNECKVPFVLAGTEVVAQYISQNNELNQRFRAMGHIERFDYMDDESEADFKNMLRALAAALPVGLDFDISEEPIVQRFFCACEGLKGDLMDVTERAVHRAQTLGRSLLRLEDFSRAYDTEFPKRAALCNPFSEDDDAQVMDVIAERSAALKERVPAPPSGTTQKRKRRA